MSFWNRMRESKVEHELRARRPQPPDELVDHISRMVGASKARVSRGRTAPKIALIAAVTAVMAASLGVAGALGYAGSSVHSFGNNVVHLVVLNHDTSRDHGQPTSHNQGGGQTGGSQTGGSQNGSSHGGSGNGGQSSQGGGQSQGGQDWGKDPYKHQYGGRWPICWQGHRIQVTFPEFIWYALHGGRPWYTCQP
jgi:uncharacterized membrane protein YgcG